MFEKNLTINSSKPEKVRAERAADKARGLERYNDLRIEGAEKEFAPTIKEQADAIDRFYQSIGVSTRKLDDIAVYVVSTESSSEFSSPFENSELCAAYNPQMDIMIIPDNLPNNQQAHHLLRHELLHASANTHIHIVDQEDNQRILLKSGLARAEVQTEEESSMLSTKLHGINEGATEFLNLKSFQFESHIDRSEKVDPMYYKNQVLVIENIFQQMITDQDMTPEEALGIIADYYTRSSLLFLRTVKNMYGEQAYRLLTHLHPDPDPEHDTNTLIKNYFQPDQDPRERVTIYEQVQDALAKTTDQQPESQVD